MELICSNCWNKENKCKCNKRRLVEIDDNISQIIIDLNKKDYKTKFCCGGHSENDIIYIYISFEYLYNFNILPKDFQYEKRVGHNLLSYINDNNLNITEKEIIINDKINNLVAWVKGL